MRTLMEEKLLKFSDTSLHAASEAERDELLQEMKKAVPSSSPGHSSRPQWHNRCGSGAWPRCWGFVSLPTVGSSGACTSYGPTLTRTLVVGGLGWA